MPDVWTANPAKFKTALTELGASCGVPSRVLHPRDPEWTCHVHTAGFGKEPGPQLSYDIYIHPYTDIYASPLIASALVIFLGGGILLGLFWGKRFWR